MRWRMLGLIPLIFFISHFIHHANQGTPHHILWVCHVSNLLLALGLLFQIPFLIRIAFLWQIPGIPLWIANMIWTGDYSITTFLSHIGGVIIGLIAFAKVRAEKWMWLYAWIYVLLLQILCRFVTPANLNVNVAFSPYYGWDKIFQSYAAYWALTALEAAAGLWLMGFILNRLFPTTKPEWQSGVTSYAGS